jgi:hypothetical protein
MQTTRAPTLSPKAAGKSISLHRVPEPDEIPEVARGVRRAWGIGPTSRFDVSRVCKRLGVDVSIVLLGVPDGGAQGFLLPQADGRFLIEVDAEPRSGWDTVSPRLRGSLKRHRERFLIAHELAHTLFYERSAEGPRRLAFDSSHQEAFCDELARALLVPPDVARAAPFTPEGVIEIQRRFDVSMELALRGIVAARDEPGAAWLLLRRDGETLIQWTSAARGLTKCALRALRRLAAQAARERRAVAGLIAPQRRAHALHLPSRDQVIVTWPYRAEA